MNGTPRLPLTLLLCFLGAVCEGFDVQTAGVAAAGLRDELRPDPAALGVFFSVGGAGLLVGSLAGGWLSDRIGRKRVLVASVAAFGIFSLLTSLAPTMGLLTVARFLTGLGLGGAMPNLVALAADVSTSGRRNASIAMAYIGMPLGAATASLCAVLLAPEDWRMLFRIGGMAPLVIAPLMAMGLSEAPAAGAPRPRDRDGVVVALFGGGRQMTTVALWVAFFFIVLTLHLMLNWLPLLLIGRGLAKSQAALAQAGFNVGGASGALALGALLDTRWRRTAMVAGGVLLPVVLTTLALVPASVAGSFALALLLGGGILAVQVVGLAVANVAYPAGHRGIGVGSAIASGRAGSLVGPLAASVMLGAGGSAASVLLALLPVVLLAIATTLALGLRHAPAEGV
jgi:MFS transporter, AAHS family, 3-hydroxyphenylpropionic acid transporter